MKNRSLRLVTVLLLIVAMVLTMAACGNEPTPTPAPTATATATPAPTTTATAAPTATPTPTPSVAPVEQTDLEKAEAEYGIKVNGADATYDKTAGKNFAYLSIPESLANKNYVTAITGITVDYEGDKATYTGSFGKLNGDGAFVQTNTTFTAGDYAVALNYAGTYTITFEVTVDKPAYVYGAFIREPAEQITYSIEKVITVAKKDVKITPVAYADKVGTADYTYYGAYRLATDTTPAAGLIKTTDDALTAIILADAIDPALTADSVIWTPDGTYSVKEAGAYTFTGKFVTDNDATELETIDEIVFVNYNVTIDPFTFYAYTADDEVLIQDVATTIVEIADMAKSSKKYELALERYNALTEAQKAYFNYDTASGLASLTGTDVNSTTTYAGWSSNDFEADDIKDYLDAITKNVAIATVANAFKKVVNDSKFYIYSEGDIADTTPDADVFNINNATHVAAYNTVAAAYAALSDADVATVTASAVTLGDSGATVANAVTSLGAAKAKFDAEAAAAVKELIAGAVASYNKAIANLGTANAIYKTDATVSTSATAVSVWKYINNAEVQSTTSQAKAAYDKLTDAQKGIVKADTTWTGVSVLTANFNTSASASDNNYVAALNALVAMNKIVPYMVQIADYINIEDYAHLDGTTPVYDRLNAIVYGTDAATLAFGTRASSATPGQDGKTHFAMLDLIDNFKCADEAFAGIIEEYKGWIDAVLAIETEKAAVISRIDAAIAAAISAGNYVDGTVKATASNTSNVIYTQMKKAIMAEGAVAYGNTTENVLFSKITAGATATTKYFYGAGATDVARIELDVIASSIYNNVTTTYGTAYNYAVIGATGVFNAGICNYETVAEAFAEIAEAYDAEAIAEAYVARFHLVEIA